MSARSRKPTERRPLTSGAIADFDAPEPAAPAPRTYDIQRERRAEIGEVDGKLRPTKASAKSAPPAKTIVHLRLVDARTSGAVTRRHNCAHLTGCEDEWMRHKGGAMAYCPGKCEHEAPVAVRDRCGGGSGRSTWMEGA